MIDAVRSILFVHGVQWERDSILAGYSKPLADRIQAQAPSTRFRFQEVLWSDVVEPAEEAVIATGSLASVIPGQSLSDIIWRLLRQILGRMNVTVSDADRQWILTKPIAAQVSPATSLRAKAMSAVLDIIFYESWLFKHPVQEKVIEALDACADEPSPVLFGHSLGSVIAYDVIQGKSSSGNTPPVYGLVTAGSPLGVLKRITNSPKGFSAILKRIDWINFYDSDDFLAFWNPLRKFGYDGYVQDRNINPSEIPFYSHTKYWDSSAIARELADMATTDD